MIKDVNRRNRGAGGRGGRLKLSAVLMVVAILGITGFQVYWLKNNYDREKENLDITARAAFRQSVMELQSSKLNLDRIFLRKDSTPMITLKFGEKIAKAERARHAHRGAELVTTLNLVQQRLRDSLRLNRSSRGRMLVTMSGDTVKQIYMDSADWAEGKNDREVAAAETSISIGVKPGNKRDTFSLERREGVILQTPAEIPGAPVDGNSHGEGADIPPPDGVLRFLYNLDSMALRDSVTLREVEDAFRERLRKEQIGVGFSVSRLDSAEMDAGPNTVLIGFSNPVGFRFSLSDTLAYMAGKLKFPFLFSLLLVGLTIFSFVLLYRNMLKQQRLAELKNEFISNITHELKTPIATVGAAIEALRTFNAIEDPVRTREYLSISQNELHRLNLLVDKVLKLSMFEKKEVELKYETVDLAALVKEVTDSMRLQVEKHRAAVELQAIGDTVMRGDRLHLLSVIFNLVDNGLKYGSENTHLSITVRGEADRLFLTVADNGMGIPAAYQEKVFEKFFRVPQGDTHNARGYGLGLSYAAQVIRKHKGSISVESRPGEGTVFTVELPRNPDV